MTTPNPGEVNAVPEFSSAICTVNSRLSTNSGHRSCFGGHSETPRRNAQAVTKNTPTDMRQKALHSGGTLSTPMRIEIRLPPHNTETSSASRMLRVESGSMGADAERNSYCRGSRNATISSPLRTNSVSRTTAGWFHVLSCSAGTFATSRNSSAVADTSATSPSSESTNSRS